MPKVLFSLLLLSTFIFGCNQNNSEDTNDNQGIESEFITWKLNGVDQVASIVQKNLTEIESGYITFSDGGASQFYFEFEDAGNFNLNESYNLSDYEDYDFGFDGSSPIDTFFTEGTFKLTRNDANWVEGEFSGSNAKTNENEIINDINLTLSQGKFKLQK